MNPNCAKLARAAVAIAAISLLGACAGPRFGSAEDAEINAFPANYKPEILAAMHAYLNNPTGVRDAAISQPMQKSVGGRTRYVVCLQFNAKRDDGSYAGSKQIAAVFVAGRFDDFVEPEAARQPCADAVFAPFPELEHLQP